MNSCRCYCSTLNYPLLKEKSMLQQLPPAIEQVVFANSAVNQSKWIYTKGNYWSILPLQMSRRVNLVQWKVQRKCQGGEATAQEYMHAEPHKQHTLDRSKQSLNQRFRSSLSRPAMSSCEWWWIIKQPTGGGGTKNVHGIMVPANNKDKAFTTIFRLEGSHGWSIFLVSSPSSLKPLFSQFSSMDVKSGKY